MASQWPPEWWIEFCQQQFDYVYKLPIGNVIIKDLYQLINEYAHQFIDYIPHAGFSKDVKSCPTRWNVSDKNSMSFFNSSNKSPVNSGSFIKYKNVSSANDDEEPSLPAPTVSSSEGSVFEDNTQIIMNKGSGTSEGAVLRYTTDGTEVTAESDEYEEPFDIDASTTIIAAACIDDTIGDQASLTVYKKGDLIAPNIASSLGDLFSEKTAITISKVGEPEETAVLRYTTDGSDVTAESEEYSGQFYITDTATIKAAMTDGEDIGPQTEYKTTKGELNAPTISSSGGEIFDDKTTVSIAVSDDKAPEGYEIRYTVDNTVVTLSSPVYTKEFEISATTYIKASVCFGSHLGSQNSVEFVKKGEILAPKITSSGGLVFIDSSDITIEKDGEPPSECVLRYSTDGSDITESSSVYSSAITITASTTIKAALTYTGYVGPQSEIYAAKYGELFAPTVESSNGSVFYGSTTITMTENGYPSSGTAIRYTTNGDSVSSSSKLYTAPFSFSISMGDDETTKTATIKAADAASDGTTGPETSLELTAIKSWNAPKISGTLLFDDTSTVTIEADGSIPSASLIRYTLDGTTPTTSSKLYSAPFEISESCVVTAAVIFGTVVGDSSTATFIKNGELLAPTITSSEGSGFEDSTTITITANGSPPAVSILRYTIDGSNVSLTSPIYAEGISIDSTTTINAAMTYLLEVGPQASLTVTKVAKDDTKSNPMFGNPVSVGSISYSPSTQKITVSVNSTGGPTTGSISMDVNDVFPLLWNLLIMIPIDLLGSSSDESNQWKDFSPSALGKTLYQSLQKQIGNNADSSNPWSLPELNSSYSSESLFDISTEKDKLQAQLINMLMANIPVSDFTYLLWHDLSDAVDTIPHAPSSQTFPFVTTGCRAKLLWLLGDKDSPKEEDMAETAPTASDIAENVRIRAFLKVGNDSLKPNYDSSGLVTSYSYDTTWTLLEDPVFDQSFTKPSVYNLVQFEIDEDLSEEEVVSINTSSSFYMYKAGLGSHLVRGVVTKDLTAGVSTKHPMFLATLSYDGYKDETVKASDAKGTGFTTSEYKGIEIFNQGEDLLSEWESLNDINDAVSGGVCVIYATTIAEDGSISYEATTNWSCDLVKFTYFNSSVDEDDPSGNRLDTISGIINLFCTSVNKVSETIHHIVWTPPNGSSMTFLVNDGSFPVSNETGKVNGYKFKMTKIYSDENDTVGKAIDSLTFGGINDKLSSISFKYSASMRALGNWFIWHDIDDLEYLPSFMSFQNPLDADGWPSLPSYFRMMAEEKFYKTSKDYSTGTESIVSQYNPVWTICDPVWYSGTKNKVSKNTSVLRGSITYNPVARTLTITYGDSSITMRLFAVYGFWAALLSCIPFTLF